jgi:hypothetical protein
MLSIRIVAGGALALVMTAGGAMAQTATDAPAGKPIQLLQILSQPDKTKMKAHPRRALKTATVSGKRSGKRHFLAAKERPARVLARAKPIHVAEAGGGPTAAAADVWRDATAATPSAATPAPVNVAATQAVPPPPAVGVPDPSELVVGGQTVHVASPEDANEIDHAADAQPTPVPAASPAVAAAPTAAVTETVAAAQTAEEPSHVGSASWIAQVLAAVGGAVAAGSAAWFLMGSAPQRTYG